MVRALMICSALHICSSQELEVAQCCSLNAALELHRTLFTGVLLSITWDFLGWVFLVSCTIFSFSHRGNLFPSVPDNSHCSLFEVWSLQDEAPGALWGHLSEATADLDHWDIFSQ